MSNGTGHTQLEGELLELLAVATINLLHLAANAHDQPELAPRVSGMLTHPSIGQWVMNISGVTHGQLSKQIGVLASTAPSLTTVVDINGMMMEWREPQLVAILKLPISMGES